jgi:hypothetical protein
MDKANRATGKNGPHTVLKTAQESIDEFFDTYHPAKAEEYFREISAVLRTPGMSITSEEERKYLIFFERINELIKANHLQRS